MNFSSLKSYFLKTMIGCLVAAALLAIVTVLIGKFNDVSGKALFTIALVAVHCLLSFSFIVNGEKEDTLHDFELTTNTIFGVIVLSFITSVLATWSVLSWSVTGELYSLYFVIVFAVLHAQVLAKLRGFEPRIDKTVVANFFVIPVVVVLLIPVIFFGDDIGATGDLYYRILAVFGIIDTTLTLLAMIFNRLYAQKHPELMASVNPETGQPVPRRSHSILRTLVIIYVVLQVVGFVLVLFIGSIFS